MPIGGIPAMAYGIASRTAVCVGRTGTGKALDISRCDRLLGSDNAQQSHCQRRRVFSEQHTDTRARRDNELAAGHDVATRMKSEITVQPSAGKEFR